MTNILKDRRVWLGIGAIAAFAAVQAAGAGSYLSLETLRAHRHDLGVFVASHYLIAAAAYAGVYILVVALSVPGATLMTLAGGFLFGPAAGTVLAVSGATTGATAVFLYARLVFGDNALRRLGPKAERLAINIRHNAWSYLLVLRLVPLFPFFLVNLIPAFAGVRLRTYVLTTCLGILPATAIFALSGAGLGDVLDSGGAISVRTILTPNVLLGLIGLALLSLAAIPLSKRFGAGPAKASQPKTPD